MTDFGNIVTTGISSLFGNKMSKRSLKAQREYNANQLKISQMNNEFNAREAALNRSWQTSERDAQNAWNLEQWNRENEYNSAAAQRARWEEAGFNPFLMNGTAGTASSMTSSEVGASAPAQSAGLPHQVPLDPYADSRNFLDILNNTFKTAGSAYNLFKDIQYGDDKRKADIAGAVDGNMEWLDDRYKNRRQNAAPQMADTDIGTKTETLEGLRIQNQYTAARSLYVRLQAKAQNIINKFLPVSQKLQLFNYASQIFVDVATGKLKMAEAKTQLSEYLRNMEDTRGKRIKNNIAEQTSDALIRAMNEENEANSLYYSAYRNYAQQIAANEFTLSNWNRDQAKLDYNIKKLAYDRTEDTWYKYSWYRNLMNSLGGLENAAQLAALFVHGRPYMKGMGIPSSAGKASGKFHPSWSDWRKYGESRNWYYDD